MSQKNEEKAHAMLNRWVAMKKELNSRSKEKRPSLSTECNNLQECERWRGQIIKEVTKKVADIQNASLGEYKIRELNDEINKLFREKGHWEDRIKLLGGIDHKKLAPRAVDSEGYELPGSGGYKYWGAAKDLPGVRELFAKQIPNAPRKNRVDLYRNIDYDYYGGECDDILSKLEQEAEDLIMIDYLLELEESEVKANKKQKLDQENAKYVIRKENFNEAELERFRNLHTPNGQPITLNKNDEEIEKLVLEKKKKQLIKLLNLEEIENFVQENQEILRDNKIVLQNLQSNMTEI
jgi:pre-mRNA-splicing factor ISY1